MWQSAKNHYHLGQAMLANLIYMFPSRKLKIIGVTGTDGKTTTASIIYHILNQTGHKTALITTVGAIIGNHSSDLGYHVTTPGRFILQSYLKRAIKFEVEYVVLEITSHALDQHRAFGIPIEIGVLTNVTNEHLDYHKTYEKYVAAKFKLIKKAKKAVLNKDDGSFNKITSMNSFQRIKNSKKIITYGMTKSSDINVVNFPFKTKLLGEFNIYNCLAAISVAKELQIPDEDIRRALITYSPPKGRQEIVYDQDFTVINDFAHTPNAFVNILPEIAKITKGRLIHVFGAAGKRDKYKRAQMGKISSDYSDVIILTAEDPRDESIDEINSQIVEGVKNPKFEIQNSKQIQNLKIQKNKKYIFFIPDRKDAIEFAISIAREGDTILLTGKGHEKSMNYGRGEEPWDENKTALEAIENRKQ